jgi:hypothetical protein
MPPLAGTNTEWADRSHHNVERGHGRTEHRTVRLATAAGIDFPHATQVFRTVRYRGGLDGKRTAKQAVYGINAPRGASLYTQRSWEELEGRFLGPMAYLDAKARGNSSLPEKQRSCSGV